MRQKAVSEEEINNLNDGHEKMRSSWDQILNTYKFYPSRTSTNKYKQMKVCWIEYSISEIPNKVFKISFYIRHS